MNYIFLNQGIYGLKIRAVRNSHFADDYVVIEDLSRHLDLGKTKVVNRGNLSDCRQYLEDRFRGKKG